MKDFNIELDEFFKELEIESKNLKFFIDFIPIQIEYESKSMKLDKPILKKVNQTKIVNKKNNKTNLF